MQRTDQDWIRDLSTDDDRRETALEDLRSLLVARLARSLRSSAYHSRDLPIEDFIQEALLRIVSHLETFRGDSRFTTWATTIAMRVALTELRRSRWRDVSLDEMVEAGRLMPLASNAAGAENGLLRRGLSDLVHWAIETELTGRQRQAIQAELGGAPPEEIARRLQTNRNAVYKLVYDARVRLKRAILRQGWSEQEVLAAVGDK